MSQFGNRVLGLSSSQERTGFSVLEAKCRRSKAEKSFAIANKLLAGIDIKHIHLECLGDTEGLAAQQ